MVNDVEKSTIGTKNVTLFFESANSFPKHHEGGYVLDEKTRRSRPDICFPVAYILAYAATIGILILYLLSESQVLYFGFQPQQPDS